MENQNIFAEASRLALRFESIRGLLTAENLWELNLTSKDGFDLNNVAKAINANLKAAGEEDFVATKANAQRTVLELKLEVVKHVIAYRQMELAKREAAAAKGRERLKLTEILGKKQDEALENLTEDQIKARLAELG